MSHEENLSAPAACTAPGKPRSGILHRLDDNFEKPALMLGMLLIILIITYQTFIRYIVTYIADPATSGLIKDGLIYLIDNVFKTSRNINVTWTEETSRFIFIWISYLAIPLAIRERSNIRVDLFYDKFPEKWRKILWIVMDMLFLAFALIILTPILLPVVVKVGVDPLHFGIIMVVNLAIGFITPPVGVNLFVASGIAKAKIADLAKVSLPLLAVMIGILLLITFVPEIPLFLTK